MQQDRETEQRDLIRIPDRLVGSRNRNAVCKRGEIEMPCRAVCKRWLMDRFHGEV